MSRQAVKYNKIVGIVGGEIYVLDEIFNYGDGFKGATGYSMRPVFQDEIDNGNDPDTVADYYSDLWREQVASGATELGLTEWCEQLVRECGSGSLYPLDDPSFRDDFKQAVAGASDEIKQAVAEIGGDCVAWQVCGCGRCFDCDMAWDRLLDRQLWDEIKQAERKGGDNDRV